MKSATLGLILIAIMTSACTSTEKVYRPPLNQVEFEEAQAHPENDGYVVRYVKRDRTFDNIMAGLYIGAVFLEGFHHSHDDYCHH